MRLRLPPNHICSIYCPNKLLCVLDRLRSGALTDIPSNDPSELSQLLCRGDGTVNIDWYYYCCKHTAPLALKSTHPGRPSVVGYNEWCRWFQPQLGKKRRVLHSSRHCDLDCWHTGSSWLMTLAVIFSQPSD